MFRSLQLTTVLYCLVLALGFVLPGAPAVQATAPGYHWVATWGLPAAPGTLNRPTSLDVDSTGNVYLVDAGLDRVQVFQPDGTFQRSLGSAGVGPGELLNPVDVSVRGDRVYIADYDAGRTQVWTLQGIFVREISGNTGTGELMYTRRPDEVGADGSGRVFIAGYAGVLRYAADGTLEREYPAEPCSAYTERALAVLSTGVFFCPSMYGGLSRVALNGASQTIGNVPGQPDYLGSVHMLATAPDDSVWGINGHTRQAHHLSAAGAYLGSFTLAEDALNLAATADRLYVLLADFTVAVYGWDGTRLAQWGQPAFTAAGSFDQPDRLAAAPDGTLYVLERGRRRIQQLDANGNVLGVLNNGSASAANLDKPQDLVMDGAGRLHVLDGQRVLRFQNGLLDAVLPSGSYTGVFLSAIAAFGDHRLIVTDSGTVWRANLDGVYAGGWGGGGFADMAVDAAGSVYLLGQAQPPLVNAYTLTGAVGATWGDQGRTGDAPGVFLQPTGIAADLRGQVIVVDTDRRFGATISTVPVFGSRVQVFTAAGQHLTSFGSFGAGAGQMIGAQSVVALADGRIVVADTENNRLQVFAPDSALPPLTPLPAETPYGPEAQPLFATWANQGPAGGTVSVPRALAVGQPMVALYGNGQLAATDDGGAHWRRIGTPQAAHSTWASIFYAGRSTLIAQKSLYDAPYRSTDGGYSWARLGNAFVTGNYYYLAASPAFDADGVLFASVYGGGFWRSTDRGNSWQRRGLVGENINEVAVAVNASGQRTLLLNGGGKQYLGRQVGTNGLLRSTDDGATWQRVSPTNAVLAAFAFSPAFAADQTAFAVYGSSGSNGYVLYRSTDAGRTWNELGALPFPQGEYFLGLTFSPAYAADRSLIVWSSSRIYRSSDAGVQWQAIGRAGDVNTPWIVAFSPTYPQTHAIWVCESTYDSRFRQTTDDGATWQPIGSGLPGTAIYGLAGAEAPEAAPPWALSSWGLLAADANGGNWAWFKTYGAARPDARDVFVRSPAFSQDQTAIVSNAMTSDGGVTWRTLDLPGPFYPDSDTHSTAVFAPDFAASRRILLVWDALAFCGQYRCRPTHFALSEDAGATWQELWQTSKSFLPATIVYDARWPATPNIYLGGEGGIYKSVDDGQTWTAAGLEAQAVRGLVSRLEGSQHVLYAATRTAGVWRSLDEGATWMTWNAGLPDGHVCALTKSPEALAAGLCDGRAYLWSATLNAWQRVGARLPSGINALLLQGGWPDGTLWAGTNDGVYRARLVEGPVYTVRLPTILHR